MRLEILFLMGIVAIAGCVEQVNTNVEQDDAPDTSGLYDWKAEELTDLVTGDVYKISDFEGKPVLIESFAVWCSTCLKQQREMKNLMAREGDSIVHISLDMDPNEDESKVRGHFTKHDFNWKFSVAPTQMTQALIDEFGLTVVSAPRAPIVLVCEDLTSRLLPTGVKSPTELNSEIAKGC